VVRRAPPQDADCGPATSITSSVGIIRRLSARIETVLKILQMPSSHPASQSRATRMPNHSSAFACQRNLASTRGRHDGPARPGVVTRRFTNHLPDFIIFSFYTFLRCTFLQRRTDRTSVTMAALETIEITMRPARVLAQSNHTHICFPRDFGCISGLLTKDSSAG